MSIESRSRQYGKVFHHWQIRDFLGSGSGGKSAVFCLVHSENSAVKSAMKVISLVERRGSYESLSETRKAEYDRVKQQCKARASQEVLLMNDLQGRTNVVDYQDHTYVDWADGNGYGCDMLIRMELLEDLRGRIEAEHEFSQEEILKIGREISGALVLCHQKGILHRDIKPENIFFNKDGNYKLGDFGVSRILSAVPTSKASTGVGTLEYAAPEQMSGGYDKQVDIYSLGLVLYELSNKNCLPFASSTYITEQEVQERLSGKPLPRPSNVSRELAEVILKACAYNPKDRYQTAEELLAALNGVPEAAGRMEVREEFSNSKTENADSRDGGYGTVYAGADGGRNATQYASGDGIERNVRGETVHSDQKQSWTPVHESAEAPKKKLPMAAVIAGCALIAVCLLFLLSSGKAHEHSWRAATCTSARTCTECGETEGRALGHDWMAATCTDPKTCRDCGETEGSALGHQWIAATHDTPRICPECGETEGEAMVSYAKEAMREAPELADAGQFREAIQLMDEASADYDDTECHDRAAEYRMAFAKYLTSRIVAGKRRTAIISGNGNVDCFHYTSQENTGYHDRGAADADDWKSIVSIDMGDDHIVGLTANGNVIAAGDDTENQIWETGNWSKIVAIAAGDYHTVALTENNRLLSTECTRNFRKGQDDMWSLEYSAGSNRIVAIAAGYFHTLALLEDGRVVAVGSNENYACSVGQWEDVAMICAGTHYSAALKTDGTVLATQCQAQLDSWTDIVQLSAGDYFLLGLRSDGTVLYQEMFRACEKEDYMRSAHIEDVEFWKEIEFISAGHDHAVAIDIYGNIKTAGYTK